MCVRVFVELLSFGMFANSKPFAHIVFRFPDFIRYILADELLTCSEKFIRETNFLTLIYIYRYFIVIFIYFFFSFTIELYLKKKNTFVIYGDEKEKKNSQVIHSASLTL